MENKKGDDRIEELPLAKVVSHLLEECRMVLPGIQAIFGFQLIAVFSQNFPKIPHREQIIHVVAISLIALAIALVMSPAAYHRQREVERASDRFVMMSSRILLLSMVPLAMGICLDLYIVAAVITDNRGIGLLTSLLLFAFFISLWFIFPQIAKRKGQSK